MGVVIDDGEKFAALSIALKRAAEDGLNKVLDEGFRNPMRELIPVLEASQFHVMPKRGGMARIAAERTGFTTRKALKGSYPGMKLVAKQRGRIQRQDRGVLRHPLFADPDKPRDEWKWVNQPIEKGWFTDVVKGAADNIARRQRQVLDDVVRQIDVDVARGRKGR